MMPAQLLPPPVRLVPSPKTRTQRPAIAPPIKRHDHVFRILDQQIQSYFDELQWQTAREEEEWRAWNDESRTLCATWLLEDDSLSRTDRLKVLLWQALGGIPIDLPGGCSVDSDEPLAK